jgi:hypothetical protein
VVFLSGMCSRRARDRTATAVRFSRIPMPRASVPLSTNDRRISSSARVHGLVANRPTSVISPSPSVRLWHDCKTSFDRSFKYGFEPGLCQQFVGRAERRVFSPLRLWPGIGQSRRGHCVSRAQFLAPSRPFDVLPEAIHGFFFNPISTSRRMASAIPGRSSCDLAQALIGF